MIRPTIEKIDEIIDELKTLQATIAIIKDKPLEFQEHKENNDKSVSIEQLIRLVAGQGLSENKNEQVKTFTLSDETLEWFCLPKNELTLRIIAKLKTLPMHILEKLRTDDIPKLLCVVSVAKVKKQVWHGESPFTEEAQNLYFIQKEIDKQIQKNIEAAKERRLNKHIQPLRDEIEILLSPYDDFLQKYITLDVKDLSSGNTSPLGRLIHEFEKIRYLIKTEAEQAVPEKPAKTGAKEIFEAKPGVAGFTVNIKEIAKRIWMRVCYRRKG